VLSEFQDEIVEVPAAICIHDDKILTHVQNHPFDKALLLFDKDPKNKHTMQYNWWTCRFKNFYKF